MREAHAALVVGDATRPATLESMSKLADVFLETLPGRYLSFVVNKLDLLDTLADFQLPATISGSGLPMAITSAKTGENIKQTFDDAAETILRRERT